MNIKFKLPYNYQYSRKVMDYLEENIDLINSIYFSFSKGSRPIKQIEESKYSHLKKLESIKKKFDCKLNYVMNSVIPIDVTEFDEVILESGLVDIVTIARDDVFQKVQNVVDKFNMSIDYEASRFYNHIETNENLLFGQADILTYGFEDELPEKRKENQKLCFIANERCYPKCQYKIKHNTNVVLRNLGKTNEKFSCPYKDKREIYSKEFVRNVCINHNIDLIKLCDRTMSDDELLEVYNYWFPFIQTL